MIIFLLISAVFLVGCILLFVSLRGRRIDDHPICLKCKYDLVGTAQLPAKCPECGIELSKPRATRIGNRKRRRAMLAIGILIFVTSLTTGGFFGWAQAKKFDWYPYKPLWMLQSEIEQDPGIKGARKATTEIFRRLSNDKLSDSQIHNVVNKALDLQIDPNANWNFFWGDFLEEAWLKGKLEDEMLKQYFKFIFDECSTFEIRSKVRSTGQAMYRFSHMPKRAGSGKRFNAMIEYGPFKIDGETLDESRRQGTRATGGGGGGSRGSTLKFPEKLGRIELIASQHIWIFPTEKYKALEVSPRAFKDNWKLQKDLAICDWTQDFTKQIELVDDSIQVLEYKKDSELAEVIRQSTREIYCYVNIHNKQIIPTCHLRFIILPEAVSFDIYWRIGDKEWMIATIAADTNKQEDNRRRQPMFISSEENFPNDASAVDVILRSNPKHAERLAAVESVWVGEDIIFKNQSLKVQRQDDD